ncbi:MAG: hypothetical protein AAF721_31930 [Myxococcota bacterium]
MHLELADTATDDWLSVRVICVGDVPPHRPTPSAYGLLSRAGEPSLRIDVYCGADELVAFKETALWSDHAVIGLGHRVYFVSVDGSRARGNDLGSYFGHLYPAPGSLLVASAERVHRFNDSGRLVWKSEPVGLDGVLVHDAGPPIIRGEGEWDPPGGWRPFALAADTGTLVEP